jgi:hypothetical protein
VASRFLPALAGLAGMFTADDDTDDTDNGQYGLLDVDDTVIEVHGYAKHGAGFGYTGVRGSARCWQPCPLRPWRP